MDLPYTNTLGVSLQTKKSIKVATSLWMKQSADFPNFRGWEEGYASFTYSYKEKDILIKLLIHYGQVKLKNSLKPHFVPNFNYRTTTVDNGLTYIHQPHYLINSI